MDFRIQSFKQAAVWSTAIGAFSQGLALLFGMLMAALFGAQESTDVLYYCLGIFALLTGMFQAINVSVLIPETMRRRHQVGEADAMAFLNRFFAAFALAILALTAWMLWKPAGTLTLISRFPRDTLERQARLVFWLLATLPLQMIAQLLLDILVSYRFLTLPATLSCVNRIINILFVWLFHRELGVVSVALGMLLGFGLQILLNLYLLRHAIRWNPYAWRTRIGGAVYRNVAWAEAGTLASTLAGYLPLFLFSGLGAGILTALNYARRLTAVPTQLMTAQVSNVTGIKFNEQAARRDLAGMGSAFDRIQRLLVFVLVPLAFVLAALGAPLVRILFGRGAFGAAAVRDTALLFSVLILVLPAEALNSVIARMNIARQEVGFGTRWQIGGNLLNAAIVYGFVRWLGAIGFPVGTGVFYVLYLVALARPFSRRLAPASLGPTLKCLGTTMAAGAVAAGLAWGVVRRWLPVSAGPWAEGAAMAGLFAVVYAGILRYVPPDRRARDDGLAMLRAALRRLAPAPRAR